MGTIHDKIDNRNIEIDNVGICDYKIPLILRGERDYSTIAQINAGVFLGKSVKGAHLSRIVEVFDEMVANRIISISDLNTILRVLQERLETDNANMQMNFPLVVPTLTPVSNRLTYLNTDIILSGRIANGVIEKNISFTAQGAMLCPNSKSISAYGAHSQKCNLKATLYGQIDNIVLEKVLEIIFSQFSAEVYGIVKSIDEKHLTEKAYNNPKFSEDLIRDVLISLREYYTEGMILAEIKNLESIHQHNVYARGLLR